jgi:hypothetical protein
MRPDALSAFDRTPAELEQMLAGAAALFPEYEAARPTLAALRDDPRVRAALAQTEPLMADIGEIPQTTYSRYRAFQRTGAREPYETPYFSKRAKLHAAALRLLFGRDDLRDVVHDYLWAICEESTWVIPAHARVIDLMSAETAFGLAEILALVGTGLNADVRRRVRDEIDRRIFEPFLRGHYDLRWFNGGDNWNGVCSGAIGGAFLYLEREPGRLAEGLALILESLKTFLAAAFEEDGSSTEGVGYWQYGMTYVVIFAELLRARTGGAIDILAAPRVRQIAAYPGKMLLPGGRFVSFSDSAAVVPFNPGITARLALRTGERSLWNVLAHPAPLAPNDGVSLTLRNLLWWDGSRPAAAEVGDATLPAGGIARLTARTAPGAPVVVAIKAGHNDENHNHNDVGSFILHVAGEDLLTDPGPGRYDRDYFSARRYESVFANSYGHSVPRIDGQLQGTGRGFAGALLGVDADEATGRKAATVEFGRAYPVPTLATAQRQLILATTDAERGVAWLHDSFRFTDEGHDIEEALVTWLPVEIDGATATIRGRRHLLRLTIEQPSGAHFTLESLELERRADDQPGLLRRLRFALPRAATTQARVRLEIVPTDPPDGDR